MATTIKVIAHNYPALVQVLDREYGGQSEKAPEGEYRVVDEVVLRPDSGERIFNCTTTRMIKVTDLEHNDERANTAGTHTGDANTKAVEAANDGKPTGSGEHHKQDQETVAGNKQVPHDDSHKGHAHKKG